MGNASNFPKKIRIFGHTFKIVDIAQLKETAKEKKHQGQNCVGYTDWDTQSIYLEFDRPFSDLLQTFFHELIHVFDKIIANSELFPPSREELIIEIIAAGLTSAVLDNKQVWEQLSKLIRREQAWQR